MKNLLSLDNSKNFHFKQTVLKNSLRLRKYNSSLFNESINDTSKYTRCKSIRKYLMIPKKQIDLTEINNDKNKNKLYSEKKIFSKKFIAKLLDTQNKRNVEENDKIKNKIKPIITVNCTNKHNTYVNKNNMNNIIYKKRLSKYIKSNDIVEYKEIREDKDKIANYKTTKHLNRHRRNINKILDLKETKIIESEKTLIPKQKEETEINKTFVNPTNIINPNKKFILFQKYNTIFLNNTSINRTQTQDSLETTHTIYTNNNLCETPSIIVNKKAFFLTANNKQSKQNKKSLFQDLKTDTKNRLKKNFILNNTSYTHKNNHIDNIHNNDDIGVGILSKYKNKEKINTLNISSNKCSNDTARSSKSSNNEKNEFIVAFFEDMLDLKESFNSKNYFNYYVNYLNKKYMILYEKKMFNEVNEEHFLYCYKYFCVILVIFAFLDKDDELFEKKSKRAKEIFLKYIYNSLVYTGYHNIKTKKIKLFMEKNKFYKNAKISDHIINLLNITFKDNKQYALLYAIIIQLINNFIMKSTTDFLSLINNSILYCINASLKSKLYIGPNNSKKSEYFFNFKDEKYEKQLEDNAPPPSVPYIKKKSKKKFSLILDLDETIIHSEKFNNGYYFFVRPGAIEFLKEISNFYEIIVFTSSYKSYADYILNKLDTKRNIISYRLYKSHVIFEKGRSIKKLSMIGRDLKKVIFVDNLKINAKYNIKNLYLIPSWIGNMKDEEIYKLKKILIEIAKNEEYSDDITKGLNNYIINNL